MNKLKHFESLPLNNFNDRYTKTLAAHKLFKYIYANVNWFYHNSNEFLRMTISKSKYVEKQIRNIVNNNETTDQHKLDRMTEIADYLDWFSVSVEMRTKLNN